MKFKVYWNDASMPAEEDAPDAQFDSFEELIAWMKTIKREALIHLPDEKGTVWLEWMKPYDDETDRLINSRTGND